MCFLNDYIELPKFKYEGLTELSQLLQPSDWHTAINLKDRFFHIPILPAHQHLLGFSWAG